MPRPNLEDRRTRPLDGVWTVVFLTFLCLPLADLAVRGDRSQEVRVEKRNPAPRPSLAPRDLSRLPADFDAWYRDAFGLRELFVRAHARLHWSLGHCPDPTMLRAADDWLFLDDGQAEALQARPRPFDERQLAAWRSGLVDWRDWLAERDIAFAVAFVPSKARVYPERVPPQRVARDVDRLQALREELQRDSDLVLIDLGPALAAERAHDRPGDWVYSPHGIHWSARGALAGYRALVEALQPTLARMGATRAPLGREQLTLEWQAGAGDSWAPSLYLEDVLEVGRWQLVDAGPSPLVRTLLRASRPRHERLEQARDDLPRVLLVHDSFGPFLYEYLALHTSRLDGVHQRQLDAESVALCEPDLVLWLQAERVLDVMLPGLAVGPTGEAARAEFEASRRVLLRDVAALARGPLRAEPRDGGLALEAEPGGTLEFPPLDLARGACAVLRLDLRVQHSTVLQLIAHPAQGSNATPRELLWHQLEPDDPPLYLRLWDPAPDERLGLVFTRGAHDALLVELELRETPRPAGD